MMSFTPVDYTGVHANAESATTYGYRTRSDVMDGETAMEDDIVSELRETCNWCRRCVFCSTLDARAADEIVRLRACIKNSDDVALDEHSTRLPENGITGGADRQG